MEKVREFMRQGMKPTEAIKAALKSADRKREALKVYEFAQKYQLSQKELSSVIGGKKYPQPKIIMALIAEFGGTEAEWRELLWVAGKPEHVNYTFV
jgi:hypothetical protein